MAKPIFLIGFPIKVDASSVHGIQSSIAHLLEGEYHVIVYKTSKIQEVSFEVLNAINATDVEISELIVRVKEEIPTSLQNNGQDANS